MNEKVAVIAGASRGINGVAPGTILTHHLERAGTAGSGPGRANGQDRPAGRGRGPGSADLAVILRAAAVLGADASALDALDGLLSADETAVAFRHPLVRSAAYCVAAPAERRAVHRALAAALAAALGTADEDRRAWLRNAARRLT